MKKTFVYSLLTILALTGCQTKELDSLNDEPEVILNEDSKVFTAIIDDDFNPETRTTLDGEGNVLWKMGDQVSIFAGSTVNEQYQVTDASDGKTAASLNKVGGGGFVAGTEIDNNVAFYPYASTAEIAKSGSNYVISGVEFPATQTYAAGSFGNGAFPMVAVTSSTEDMNLKFKNILGGLKLQLKGTATIASITITGKNNEKLYGDAEVTVTYGGTPSISLTDASAKTVTLDCGAGVTLDAETATPFIIALPPMTMSNGFTVVVTDAEGKQMEISTSKSQTITRSNLLRMPAVNYVGSVPEYEYTISTGGGTKASLSGTDMVWSTGDKVLLTDGTNSALCTIPSTYDGLTTATVKTTQVLTGTITCIYPGDAVTLDGSTIYVDVPANQGTNGSNYMVYSGSSASSTITLTPKTALMKVRLTSTVDDLDYIKITFEGTPIVGRLEISDLGNSVISGTQSVQMSENGGDEYLFSVLPGSITSMSVDVVKTDGSYARKTSSSSRTISAGTISNISIDPSTLSFETPLDYFTLTSTGSTSVDLNKVGSPADIVLEYRKNEGAWTSYTIGSSVSLSDGETLQFRSDEDGNDTFSQGISNYYFIEATGTGTISASGNIMSLLDRSLESVTVPQNAFWWLFKSCSKLVGASELELPATSLADYCYYGMFQSCSNLETAPALPATTLAIFCYDHMFSGCASLSSAPALPATTLSYSCYGNMFNGCSSLTSAPELPAASIVAFCYEYMFHGCTSLTSAPELPATFVPNNSYQYMFSGCTNLTTAPELPASTLSDECYKGMFSGCSKLNYVKALFTTIPPYSNQCLFEWLYGVSATGTFVKSSSATWDITGVSGIPDGWTVETE
ncbi:leucine-rich repeat protein [bacterium]|nr:leucine-rich repeat protein [bacterium]